MRPCVSLFLFAFFSILGCRQRVPDLFRQQVGRVLRIWKNAIRINEDPAAAIEFAPSAQAASELDLPRDIPTEATQFAPRGRIIDDSARGAIFLGG